MKRNIVNPEVIDPFLKRLTERHPAKTQYILRQVRSYLLKKENIFLVQDENLGLELWTKKLIKKASISEVSMLKNQGVWGNYFRLNLNDACFERYSHYLDFASNLEDKVLEKMGFAELIIHSRRKANKQIKITRLTQGVDFEYLGDVTTNYYLVKLTSLKAYENEGEEMSHCVGKFVKPTASRTIYSLRRKDDVSMMTLSVDTNTQKVIEAKGFANRPADSYLLSRVTNFLGLKALPRAREEQNIPWEAIFCASGVILAVGSVFFYREASLNFSIFMTMLFVLMAPFIVVLFINIISYFISQDRD